MLSAVSRRLSAFDAIVRRSVGGCALRNVTVTVHKPGGMHLQSATSSQLTVAEKRQLNQLPWKRQPSRRFCTTSDEPENEWTFDIADREDFEARVLHAEHPVIVDFHADWCGPCKQLAPRLEAKVDARQGEVHLCKVNIDDNGDLAIDYGVNAVPSVMAFKHGEVVGQFIGDKADDEINVFINQLIEAQ